MERLLTNLIEGMALGIFISYLLLKFESWRLTRKLAAIKKEMLSVQNGSPDLEEFFNFLKSLPQGQHEIHLTKTRNEIPTPKNNKDLN